MREEDVASKGEEGRGIREEDVSSGRVPWRVCARRVGAARVDRRSRARRPRIDCGLDGFKSF